MKPSPAALKLAEKILDEQACEGSLESLATLIDESNKELVGELNSIVTDLESYPVPSRLNSVGVSLKSILANHQPKPE